MSFRNEDRTEGELWRTLHARLDDLERGDGHPFRWDPETEELFYVVPRTGEEVLVCTSDCCPCSATALELV